MGGTKTTPLPGAVGDDQIKSIPTMPVFQGGKIVKQIVSAEPQVASLRDLENSSSPAEPFRDRRRSQ